MINKDNKVTYEELSSKLSNFEITYLSFCKALEIIRSGRSLISDQPYQPKVALAAFEEVCKDLSATLEYKDHVKYESFGNHYKEVEDHNYEIQDLSEMLENDSHAILEDEEESQI